MATYKVRLLVSKIRQLASYKLATYKVRLDNWLLLQVRLDNWLVTNKIRQLATDK